MIGCHSEHIEVGAAGSGEERDSPGSCGQKLQSDRRRKRREGILAALCAEELLTVQLVSVTYGR